MINLLAGLVVAAGMPPPEITALVSNVYEADASQEEITRHAIACITQHATSGFLDIPTIQSSDPAVGAVVAVNLLSAEGSRMLARDTRTTLRLDAKDGRFRFSNSDIVGFSEWSLEWSPLSRSGSRWARVQDRLDHQNGEMAGCIQDAVSGADW